MPLVIATMRQQIIADLLADFERLLDGPKPPEKA